MGIPGHIAATLLAVCAALMCPWQTARAADTPGSPPAKSVKLRTFTMADGLPSNSVAMMSLDSNGMLWIATWNGLCNYDGYRFNSFLDLPGAKTVLHGNRIKYAWPAANGDVWLTTFDDRLFRLDAATRDFADCSGRLRELGLPDFHVRDMRPLPDGRIGILGADGTTLAAADGKLERSAVPLPDNAPDSFTDSRGRQWRVSADGSLSCSPAPAGAAGTYAIPSPESYPVVHTAAPVMFQDKGGAVWILPDGAPPCYYDEAADRLVPVDLREADPTVADDIYITQAMTDRQHNLWFRDSFNLCQLAISDNNFQFIPVVEGSEIRAIQVDRDGALWAGTRQGHLAHIGADGATGYMAPDGKLTADKAVFDSHGIYAIYRARDGNLWVGTRGNGVYRLTPGTGRWAVERFNNRPAGDDTGLSNVYDIRQDAVGRIWFAGYSGGISYYDSGTFHSADDIPGLRLPPGNLNKVRRVDAAPDGTLLFSTTEGVVTLDPRFSSPAEARLHISRYSPDSSGSLLAPDVLQTLVTRDGSAAYVTTMGGGLQSMPTGGLLRPDLTFGRVSRNFPNMGNIGGMIEDSRGNVWLIGENAIHCLARAESDSHTYTSNDWGGLNGFSEARPVLDSAANRILLGTRGGIISFDPLAMQTTSDVPVIVFTGIQYQGDGQQSPLVGNGEITMPTDRHNATVYFAALDYEDNLQIRYAYRILGLDDDWNYVGSERCAPLSNLPPGRYTLEVRSTNNEGVWVDNTTGISIYVEPTFWQTPWAWLIYALVAALLLFGSVYLLWLRKRRRIDKDVHERQLRFFTDISHRVRTPLTLISGPVDEVLASEHLSEKARHLLESVKGNSDTMLRLVDESLDLNKLRAGAVDTATDGDSDDGVAAPGTGAAAFDTTDLTILVVEDNDELRYLLKASLSSHYRIIEAANGREGLRMAAERQPDFIITDIMMPEMDGITMLRRIKGDPAICHIPIIIISARTADIYRIEGLKEGADDYITKPFSISYLQVRVESIVRQRRMLQEEWRRSLGVPSDAAPVPAKVADADTVEAPSGGSVSELDRRFVDGINAYIGANIQNPDLRIDDVASAMCMSRTVLYGKVKTLFGMAPNDVVRSIRIARACAILRESPEMPVAEVALAVGYVDAKYFARCFRQVTGLTPSEYRKGGARG